MTAHEIISRKSRKRTLSNDRIKENQVALESLCSKFSFSTLEGYENLVNYSGSKSEPVHRWFKYREGYSLQLIRNLLSNSSKGAVVADPFCGSGSTLVAAQELGLESYGFDINPLSVLIARVKTASYTKAQVNLIRAYKDKIARLCSDFPSGERPLLKIIGKVFQPEILDELLRQRALINSVDNLPVRNFLKVAWLAILEEVSNVYKEGNGIKYKNRKRTPAGYIRLPDEVWHRNLFPDDREAFVKQAINKKLDEMLADLERRGLSVPPAHIFEVTAEQMKDYLPEGTVDHVISSPPYCNCFNYFKIFKIELWMGEFVKSYDELRELNRRAMRSHVETTLKRDGDQNISLVDNFSNQIDPDQVWDKRIPDAVRGYFQDMRKVLKQTNFVLKPGGQAIFVVGNSAYSGVIIPTDALIASMSDDIGFDVPNIAVARHLTTSSQQRELLEDRKSYLRESLVYLTKPLNHPNELDRQFVDEVPIDPKLGKDTVFVIRNRGLTSLTHKFHRYPGKFIPHLPRWAIEKYCSNLNDVVLDPFCGSGTTLVESSSLGHTGLGIDIDPIGRLVSKVKTTPIPGKVLTKAVDFVNNEISRRDKGEFRPTIDTLHHWFTPSAVNDLGVIRDVVELYKYEPDLYDFFIVCFISIIRKASNADNQTQKTYVSHTHPKTPEPAKPLFEKTIKDYASRLIEYSKKIRESGGSATVLPLTDARDLQKGWSDHGLPEVSLAVTSPPYVKSVDYMYNQMAEYFWAGDLFGVENQPKQNIFKKRYIGSEKVSKDQYSKDIETGIYEIDKLSRDIRKKNPKNSFIVSKYFQDMIENFRQVSSILKPNGHYVVIIGDSIVSQEPIITHKFLELCGNSVGLELTNIFGYEIRNRHMRFPRQGRGGIVKYDWVLDLKNTRKG